MITFKYRTIQTGCNCERPSLMYAEAKCHIVKKKILFLIPIKVKQWQYRICCASCGRTGPFRKTKEKAIQAWNEI